jgi:hypothetical protein
MLNGVAPHPAFGHPLPSRVRGARDRVRGGENPSPGEMVQSLRFQIRRTGGVHQGVATFLNA